MKRIIVIGCPGSGKSHFSRVLNKIFDIPVFHLDMMYWNSDKTVVSRETFLDRLRAVFKYEAWIIDGNYAATMEMRLAECDTVFFLDYPLDVCLEGIRARHGIPRSDMPWVETEEDGEFIEFIKSYNEKQRPEVISLIEKYSGKKVFVFHNREEADSYLSKLCEK